MKLAIVASPSTVKYARPLAGGYHMALAHLIRDDTSYREWYNTRASWMNSEVILDNGAAEFGVAMRPEELLRIVRDFKPTVWVMPDVIMETAATMWYFHMTLTLKDLPLPFMVVPQGRNFSEWLDCFNSMRDALTERNMTAWLGISKFCLRHTERLTILEMLAGNLPSCFTHVHLLGLEDPQELLKAAQMYPWVHGCDTSTPIAMGLKGLRCQDYTTKIDMDWREHHIDAGEDALIRNNVNYLVELARGYQAK